MKRRDFILAGGSAGLGAAVSAPAIAQSKPNISWRFASSYPKTLETIYGAGQYFADAVSAATDGQFKIRVFAAGEIVPALQVTDAVSNGTIEMGHTGSYFSIGKDMAFAFGTAIPWGPNARQQESWLYQNSGNDLLNEFFEKYHLYHLPIGNTGTQMAGWFRKELKSKADLNGLKMRIGGLGGTVLSRMGVVPQQIGASDIYPSLEKGVIDAAEFVGPADDEQLGLAKVAPYYYYPGFWEGGAELSLFINRAKWEELPNPYKEIVKHCAKSAGVEMLAKYDKNNPLALRRLIANGVKLKPMPDDILEESYSVSRSLFSEISENNPSFRKMYESLSMFMSLSTPYWSSVDMTYDLKQAAAKQKGWDKGMK